MKPQPPALRRALILFGCTLVACLVATDRAQVSNTQAQSPAATTVQTHTQTPTQTPAQLPAQTAAPPASRLVTLDVIVSDESNRFVGGLRQDDFRVEVDGVPQAITFFAEDSPPLSYSLLVDNTGSMRTVFDHMLRAGVALVAGKRAQDEMSVVRFVSRDRIELVRDFTRNRNALAAALDEMYVEGGHTALLEALYVAAEAVVTRAPGDNRNRMLVVITDGGERDPRTRLEEVLTYVRRHNLPIFVFGLTDAMSGDAFDQVRGGRRGARELLERLARESGGHAVFPKKPAEFEDAALALNARLLMPRYALGYASPADASNRTPNIEVKLADSARKDGKQPRLLVGFRVRGTAADAVAPAKK
ncbi:MAG TPA: VWA domain-containing protein [Pyrinomonadaceae bacterium]